VNRFESLLETFELHGQVPEQCKKKLFELSQVRHVVIHRRGKVDRKLADACPWLQLKRGDQIKISPKMWTEYNVAVADYVLELIQRVRVSFGFPRYEHGKAGNAGDPARTA
jgi:hypothetical protein